MNDNECQIFKSGWEFCLYWHWVQLAPSLHLGVVAIEKGAFGSPSTKVANFTYFYNQY